MKKLALVLAFMASASSVQAQQRPSTLNMTCDQARQLVFSRGAAVLSTGTYTYERFVRDRSFCVLDETTEVVWAPTRDTPQCPVGFRCRASDLNFFDD
jgi:hypothetical protein